MAADLNAGFQNNVNIIAMRFSASTKKFTDRAYDFDGDGVKEERSIAVTQTGPGNKERYTLTVPTGAIRTVVEELQGTDENTVDTSGDIYTENEN